jgi:hypothetical protein
MQIAGFLLVVLGGGWCGVWLIEGLLTRSGIHQSFGLSRTASEREQSEQRGVAHQAAMLRVTRRGVPWAAATLVVGVILLVVA